MKDPLGEAPPVETRKAVTGGVLFVLALVALVVIRPSTAVTVAIIVGLILTIMLHEWGHYIAAKRSGMKVTEFFLGFGPRIWSFRRGETEYGVKAIPAGGYVRIVGMTNLEEVDPEDEARTYRQATTGKRLITVLAGIIVNLVLALVLIFAILVARGPEDISTKLESVSASSPAAAAGFRAGDKIVAIDGHRITTWDEVGAAITPHRGDALLFTVVRDGRRLDLVATPKMIDGAPRCRHRGHDREQPGVATACGPGELRDDGPGCVEHGRRARQGVLRERPREVRKVGHQLEGRPLRRRAAAVGRRDRRERERHRGR